MAFDVGSTDKLLAYGFGQVRTSTRELPPSCHTYGALVTKDLEGAGAGESNQPVKSHQRATVAAEIYQ